MSLSTQAVGVMVIAAMSVIGLVAVQDIAKQDAVVERMVHYQAEEIALDMEMMQDWDNGSIEKDLGFQYDVDVSGSAPPGWDGTVTLTRFGSTSSAFLNVRPSTTVQSASFSAKTMCIKNDEGTISLMRGEC